MDIVRSVAAMSRLTQRWHRRGLPVGLVPTMGYLHAGHVSLMHRARKIIGAKGKLVVSIYVNPTQFGPREDLARYPRDLARDTALCRAAGVDAIFVPTDRVMYAETALGKFSTYVVEDRLSSTLEGKSRPTHFRGVTTIVAKLFNIVRPAAAVFGAKDYQQAAIVRKMVCDLNFAVRMVVAPTRREAGGLAMSSRNQYLSAQERLQACVLWEAIQEARKTVRRTAAGVPASRLKRQLRRLIERQPAARVDYVEVIDPQTLAPVRRAERGAHLVLAVFIGGTRLIDNGRL